jgi:osmotically-inducible protein OsmY
MDDRQRYGYDRERNERDDFRNENWRDRDRYQDREFSMRNRYGSQDDWNTDRGRDEYISRDRQGTGSQGGYGYGQGQGSREIYRTSGDRGLDRGFDREQNYQGNRDWNERNLPENYRSSGRDRDFFNATPNWSNQQNFSDPYRQYQGQESQNRNSGSDYDRNQQNWGGEYNRNQQNFNDRFRNQQNFGSGYDRGSYGQSFGQSGQNRQDYGRGSQGYGQDYGFGGEFGYGAGSYDRYDRDRNYGQQQGYSGQQNRGRDESLTEKVGRFFGMGPKGYKRSDDRIKEDVSERLTDHPFIDASGIEIVVVDAEVTLKGSVDDRRSKRLAEDVAEQARGVKDVHNQIRVNAGATETATSGTTAQAGSEAGRKSPTGTTGDKTRAA